ncbi:MAG: TIGR01777 family oxidoreductase [Ignavibacteria bacterium]|nr:TIGR01777 family oxidoreductase [Ignavibacteria bacterium]
MKTFLITGATGLIGRNLISEIRKRNYSYIVLSRSPDKARQSIKDALMILSYDEIEKIKNEKVDVVINLAGSNIGEGRWTEKRKRLIKGSRINITSKLTELIRNMEQKPELLISSSGIDYYGDTGDKIVNEDFHSGKGFLADVCKEWESEAMKASECGVRVVIIRTGVVIEENAPAVKKILMPYRFFIGGPLGSGKQYFSWIHISDLVKLILFIFENRKITGPVNAVSPSPVTMNELAKTVGKLMRRPSILRVPETLLKLIMGEASELVISSHRVIPEKAQTNGFVFSFREISDALRDILER